MCCFSFLSFFFIWQTCLSQVVLSLWKGAPCAVPCVDSVALSLKCLWNSSFRWMSLISVVYEYSIRLIFTGFFWPLFCRERENTVIHIALCDCCQYQLPRSWISCTVYRKRQRALRETIKRLGEFWRTQHIRIFHAGLFYWMSFLICPDRSGFHGTVSRNSHCLIARYEIDNFINW